MLKKVQFIPLLSMLLVGGIGANAQSTEASFATKLKTQSQLQAANTNAVFINDLASKKSKLSSNKALTACGTDTSTYPLTAKATGFQALSLNNATSASEAGQYYNASDSITINGFDFYAWKSNTTGGASINVNAQIFLAGPDSLPTGTALATQSIAVDTTFGTGALTTLLKSVTFTTPVTVTQPYIVLVSNNSANSINLLSNNYTNGDGQGEDLSMLTISGNYLSGSSVNVGGTTFNADWLIHPHVEYNLDANFRFSPDSLYSAPSVVNVINTSTSFINDRMYNLANALGAGILSHTYDFGNGGGLARVQDSAVTYQMLQNYTVLLNDTLNQYNGNQCISSTSKVLGVGSMRIDTSDAAIAATNVLSEYSQVPLDQMVNPLVFAAIVSNLGTDTLNNVSVKYTVNNSGTAVYTDSTLISFIGPGVDSIALDVPGFVPNAVGTYVVNYEVSATNVELDLTNNTGSSDTLIVTDSTYARDNNIIGGSLGIGSGTGGELGSVYELNTADSLTSVSVLLRNTSGSMSGRPFYVNVRSFNNGTPGAIIASSDTISYPTTADTFVDMTFANNGGYVLLPADSFLVSAVETDSNITLATTSAKFRANTNFVTFGAVPWTPNENFNFVVTYFLRPNFGKAQTISVGLNDVAAPSTSSLMVYPNPSNGLVNVVLVRETTNLNVEIEVLDIQGKLVYENNIVGSKITKTQLNLSELNNGIYFVKVAYGDKVETKKLILK